ncbi:MAG TPA: M56 family metallopeptidase [Kofleriaceae bacterium]|nr:M56 family metallopeptidase [Kofleriaceae bacterium]
MSALFEAGLVAKTALATLAMMAVQGTLLGLAAFVLVRGGRLRPAWQAAVWLVVLVKFVLPWGPALAWSLADLIAMVRGGGAAAPLPAAVLARPVAAAPAGSIAPALGWLLLAAIWLAGALVVARRSLAAYRGALALARAASPAPAEAQSLLARLAAGVRVRTPRLVVGDAATGPYVVGSLRPMIVVPPALLDEPALLRPALLHELAHIRRRDVLGRFVQVLARAAFWFLPVVRMASRRLELAREAACDAWALEAGEISRPAYARLLVQMAQLRATAGAPALAAPRTLDARVRAVLGPAASPRVGLLHRAALLGWIALALGGARSAAARGQAEVCVYTPEVAEALRQAHPDADIDGDGFLTREEACDYQAALRRRISAGEIARTSESQPELLVEPLCCNCEPSNGAFTASPGPSGESCDRVEEGVDR